MYPCRGVLSSIEFSFTRKQKLIHLSEYVLQLSKLSGDRDQIYKPNHFFYTNYTILANKKEIFVFLRFTDLIPRK